MSKRLLADVLWEAANVYLSHDGKCSGNTEGYSCPAIGGAMGGWLPEDIKEWLRSLGCDPHGFTLFSRRAFAHTKHTQGLRYIWLLLAMHVAEDEGLTV
jgi:hypothetical protein